MLQARTPETSIDRNKNCYVMRHSMLQARTLVTSVGENKTAMPYGTGADMPTVRGRNRGVARSQRVSLRSIHNYTYLMLSKRGAYILGINEWWRRKDEHITPLSTYRTRDKGGIAGQSLTSSPERLPIELCNIEETGKDFPAVQQD